MLGLVLSGGAARGAYNAGVMRFLFTDLLDRLGPVVWPGVISGTSVGSLNAVFAACQTRESVEQLSALWQNIEIDQVYTIRGGGLLRTFRGMLKAAKQAALLDPSPLHALVVQQFPHARVRQAIDSGAVRAFIVSATQVESGYNTLFVDSREQCLDVRTFGGTVTSPVKIRSKHLLASTAIPLLFPPVQIGGSYYVDGGLRLNTPLRPVLRAGADKVLVIGSHAEKSSEPLDVVPSAQPSVPQLIGKTLNALMLDPVDRDLAHASRINQIVAWGVQEYGQEFATRLNRELEIREVETLFVRPQRDIGEFAMECFRASPPKATPQVSWLLSKVADQAKSRESDFLSYLYFDREYTGVLEQMGFEEARDREEDLANFILSK